MRTRSRPGCRVCPSPEASFRVKAWRLRAEAPCVTTTIEPFLRARVECGGSDLHCKVGSPPRVRIDGRLRKLQTRDLSAADTAQMVSEVLREDLVEEFHKSNEADFAYSLSGVGRFRVNAFRSRGS